MVSDSAVLVLFAIRNALKLGQPLRLAYVDNTKQRELVLPLPNFFSSPDVVSATNYRNFSTRCPKASRPLDNPSSPPRSIRCSPPCSSILRKPRLPGNCCVQRRSPRWS